MTPAQKVYAKNAAMSVYPGKSKPASVSQIQIQNKGSSKAIGLITPKDANGHQIVKISLGKLQDHIDVQDGDLADEIQDEIDKADAQGEPLKQGSSILTGASIGVILHEFYHAGLGHDGDTLPVFACEHLGIDRAVASDLCDLVKSVICDNDPASDEVDPGKPVDGMCEQIKYLNDKWEKGAGVEKAQQCALEGMDSVFPDGVGGTGVDLPSVAELEGHPENAVPDCPCCTVPKEECCPSPGTGDPVEDPEVIE